MGNDKLLKLEQAAGFAMAADVDAPAATHPMRPQTGARSAQVVPAEGISAQLAARVDQLKSRTGVDLLGFWKAPA